MDGLGIESEQPSMRLHMIVIFSKKLVLTCKEMEVQAGTIGTQIRVHLSVCLGAGNYGHYIVAKEGTYIIYKREPLIGAQDVGETS